MARGETSFSLFPPLSESTHSDLRAGLFFLFSRPRASGSPHAAPWARGAAGGVRPPGWRRQGAARPSRRAAGGQGHPARRLCACQRGGASEGGRREGRGRTGSPPAGSPRASSGPAPTFSDAPRRRLIRFPGEKCPAGGRLPRGSRCRVKTPRRRPGGYLGRGCVDAPLSSWGSEGLTADTVRRPGARPRWPAATGSVGRGRPSPGRPSPGRPDAARRGARCEPVPDARVTPLLLFLALPPPSPPLLLQSSPPVSPPSPLAPGGPRQGHPHVRSSRSRVTPNRVTPGRTGSPRARPGSRRTGSPRARPGSRRTGSPPGRRGPRAYGGRPSGLVSGVHDLGRVEPRRRRPGRLGRTCPRPTWAKRTVAWGRWHDGTRPRRIPSEGRRAIYPVPELRSFATAVFPVFGRAYPYSLLWTLPCRLCPRDLYSPHPRYSVGRPDPPTSGPSSHIRLYVTVPSEGRPSACPRRKPDGGRCRGVGCHKQGRRPGGAMEAVAAV